jgi:hypothetical protein
MTDPYIYSGTEILINKAGTRKKQNATTHPKLPLPRRDFRSKRPSP